MDAHEILMRLKVESFVEHDRDIVFSEKFDY